MFTGIIEECGKVKNIVTKKNLSQISVRVSKKFYSPVKKGDSIAINGVCLTVTRKSGSVLFFDIMRESLICTTLGRLKKENAVNLERALKASGRIDGHFVTGHVDGVGEIVAVKKDENYKEIRIKASAELLKYIVSKGSVCLDGVSLTVGNVRKQVFSVYLIPFTEKVTTFGSLGAGSFVNIETDILAKYILNAYQKG